MVEVVGEDLVDADVDVALGDIDEVEDVIAVVVEVDGNVARDDGVEIDGTVGGDSPVVAAAVAMVIVVAVADPRATEVARLDGRSRIDVVDSGVAESTVPVGSFDRVEEKPAPGST